MANNIRGRGVGKARGGDEESLPCVKIERPVRATGETSRMVKCREGDMPG